MGRADYNLASGRGSDSVGAVAWEDDDDGATVYVGEFVGFGEGVRAEIDPKPVTVREPDGCAIADGLRGVADNWLVGVGPTATARLCPHQLSEHAGIDIVALTGQITRLVVSP